MERASQGIQGPQVRPRRDEVFADLDARPGRVADEEGAPNLSDVQNIAVTVTDVNEAPTVSNSIADVTANEDADDDVLEGCCSDRSLLLPCLLTWGEPDLLPLRLAEVAIKISSQVCSEGYSAIKSIERKNKL